MIFKITGGPYHGKHLRVDSAYHVCCGTLEVSAGLISIYKRWQNKLAGCPQHRRQGGGDRAIRGLVCQLHCKISGQIELCIDNKLFLELSPFFIPA
jgi:hypothetical protein